MAEVIAAAIKEEGVEVTRKRIADAHLEDLLAIDAVVIGSPTYYGTMAAEVKQFLDESIRLHGKLDGKVGGAFASAGTTGQETTVLSILQALLIHGMVVQGDFTGTHYGATSVGQTKEIDANQCRRFGRRFGALVKRVFAATAADAEE